MKIKKKDLELFRLICKRWESLTGLILEEAFYSKMVISNVNNYLAIYDYGGVKRKGTYEYELELHKNFSMLVIPKALEAYFVHGIDVQTFIYNHTDLYDFFKRTKVNKTDRLLSVVYDEDGNSISDNEIQRITRYLITGEVVYTKETKKYHNVGQGISLIKQMPPIEPKDSKKLRDAYSFATVEQGYEGSFEDFKQLVKKVRHNNYEAGFLCTVVNQMITDEEIKKIIYYPYYIAEVYKIINVIEKNNGI
jgi:hypothetical protein